MALPNRAESTETADQQGYHRPRRPNPETLVYLKSLPLEASASSKEEIDAFLTSDKKADAREFPPVLAAALAAIDEIKHEVASLSGDEDGSEVLETLMRIAVPYSELAARTLLHGTLGYCVHLATHRYGSHVLQTLLQLAVASGSEEDVAANADAPPMSASSDLPALATLVLAIHEELMPQVSELRVHLCGSHVLRTLVCILAGVRMKEHQNKALRRGKQKTTKKKRKRALHSDGTTDGARSTQLLVEYELHPRINVAEMTEALSQMVDALTGGDVQSPGVLQQMACHPSAGPLLIILLRSLTYKDAATVWKKKQAKNAEQQSTRYSSSSETEPRFDENSSAHFLTERILCWQRDTVEQKWAGDVIYGLAGEVRGSHMLETIFKLSPKTVYESIMVCGGFNAEDMMKEYAEHEVSNFVVQSLFMTIRHKEQATSVLRAVLPLISSGYLVNPTHKRRGVMWRAVELAVKFETCQSDIGTGIQAALGKKSLGASLTGLLLMREVSEHGGTLVLDAPGANIVGSMFKFKHDIAEPMLDGVLMLTAEDLELLAKDSLGSRCIWDGIIERAASISSFGGACAKLLDKLKGRWVNLASDRVGHHVVMNLFRALPSMDDRKRLVEELSAGRSRLNGCAMGRSVMDACFVREFNIDGEQAWRALVKKMIKNSKWIKDLDEIVDKSGETSGKKRKGNSGAADEAPTAKVARHNHDSVSAIMDAMKVPSPSHK